MITRSAIFEGRIKPGFEDIFFEAIREKLAPLWAQFPNSSNLRLLRIARADSDAAPIVMIQQTDYPSYEAIDEALASPVRTKARAMTMELLEMFEGRFYHILSEGNAVEGVGAAC
jgi:hypothetical protein